MSTQIVVRNVKTLEYMACDLRSPGLNLFIGANGSGKTTLVEAMHLMSDVLDDLVDTVRRPEAYHDQFENRHRQMLRSGCKDLQIAVSQGLRKCIADVRGASIGAYKEKDLIDIKAYLGIDVPGIKVTPPKDGFIKLDVRGRNLQSALLYLQKNEPDLFQTLVWSLQGAFPNLVESLEYTTPWSGFIVKNPEGYSCAFEDCSDAIIVYLFILVAVLSTPPGGILVMDDPTPSLHPYAVRQAVGFIEDQATQYNLTVVMTTSRPDVLDAMIAYPNCVHVLIKGSEGATLTDLYNEEYLQAFTLSELYANDELGSNCDTPVTGVSRDLPKNDLEVWVENFCKPKCS